MGDRSAKPPVRASSSWFPSSSLGTSRFGATNGQTSVPKLELGNQGTGTDGFDECLAWFKKGSGTVAGTARRVLRTTVPDPFLNHRMFPPRGAVNRFSITCYARVSGSLTSSLAKRKVVARDEKTRPSRILARLDSALVPKLQLGSQRPAGISRLLPQIRNDQEKTAWFKKGSGTVAGTARRVLRTTVPDPFLNHAEKTNPSSSSESRSAAVRMPCPEDRNRVSW